MMRAVPLQPHDSPWRSHRPGSAPLRRSDRHLADLLPKSATTCATTCPGRRDGRCRCSPPRSFLPTQYCRWGAGASFISRAAWCVRTFLTQCAVHAETDKRVKIEALASKREPAFAARGAFDAPRRHPHLSRPRRQAGDGRARNAAVVASAICPDPGSDGFDDVNPALTIRTPRCAHLSLQRGVPP